MTVHIKAKVVSGWKKINFLQKHCKYDLYNKPKSYYPKKKIQHFLVHSSWVMANFLKKWSFYYWQMNFFVFRNIPPIPMILTDCINITIYFLKMQFFSQILTGFMASPILDYEIFNANFEGKMDITWWWWWTISKNGNSRNVDRMSFGAFPLERVKRIFILASFLRNFV